MGDSQENIKTEGPEREGYNIRETWEKMGGLIGLAFPNHVSVLHKLVISQLVLFGYCGFLLNIPLLFLSHSRISNIKHVSL